MTHNLSAVSGSSSLKIYIAGPDVFSLNAVTLGRRMCDAVRAEGFIPLFPLDNEIDDNVTVDPSQAIFNGNIQMIRDCDVVLANLNPFRGFEPDSGTCWEVGYAYALDKKIIGYLDDLRPMIDKVNDDNGWRIEDFGLPLNLMLSCSTFQLVEGDFATALKAVKIA